MRKWNKAHYNIIILKNNRPFTPKSVWMEIYAIKIVVMNCYDKMLSRKKGMRPPGSLFPFPEFLCKFNNVASDDCLFVPSFLLKCKTS